LTIEGELKSQVYRASGSHGSECFESGVAQIGLVFATPDAIRKSRGSKLQAEADV
jgi:hypothetical protein